MDDDLLMPISALQHLAFCPRQCALIHGQQEWADNRLTAEGQVLHARANSGEGENRRNRRIARTVKLCSKALSLTGVADVVEFHRQSHDGAEIWVPYPVEYKRGKPKPHNADRIQVCAQALCLEEMLGIPVPCGALFYGQPKRREDVDFTPELRQEVSEMAQRLAKIFTNSELPPPLDNDPRCRSCSLLDICQPKQSQRSVRRWIAGRLKQLNTVEDAAS